MTSSEQAIEPSIAVNTQSIILDFSSTGLKADIANNYNVEDFNTFAKNFIVEDVDGHSRIELFAESLAVLSSLIIDRQFILAIGKMRDSNIAVSIYSDYTGELLPLNFQDIQVRSVLQIIADFTGLNLVTSDAVTGNITLRLKDVPWNQALDLIVKNEKAWPAKGW